MNTHKTGTTLIKNTPSNTKQIEGTQITTKTSNPVISINLGIPIITKTIIMAILEINTIPISGKTFSLFNILKRT